ncbi:MAG: hypothetical protein JWM91_3279 [Rhodospirillales bacterium]|nr:hypothetical protein [Rhodospirillales bacterium]
MSFNHYAVLSAVSALTLLTTLKLTLTGRVTIGPQKKNFILFHPIWLGALVVMVPFVIGRYLQGTMSPWPVTAFAQMQDKVGLWAGVLAATATTTVDLWLFWTTATALLTFTQPMATAYEPIPKSMHKYFHLVNLIAGAFVIYKALNGHAS